MKANELRIGNYVSPFNRNDEHQMVMQVSANNIKLTEMGKVSVDDIFGIPLTEEWIIKFGFEYDIHNLEYSRAILDETLITYSQKNGIFLESRVCCHECGGYMEYVEIKHVHQLQNLYYALTGEELTIKE